jgi:hypothetical protein
MSMERAVLATPDICVEPAPAGPLGGSGTGPTLDDELRLVAALRRTARERGGPLPSIDVADALLVERRELTGLPRLTRCLGNY